MFTLVLSPLLLLLLILLLRSDDDRFGRGLRQEDDDFATPTTDDEEAENASACILQIYINIYNVCVCVIKLLRSLKTCGCLSIMCSRSFYVENFIHSDESCLAVHWLFRGNNRGKGILFQKNENEKQSSRHFLLESTHHDVAAFSHPRSANQEERKTAEKSVNVYVSAFFFFNFFFLLLQEFARSSRCRFFNKNSHRKRHHPATPFS